MGKVKATDGKSILILALVALSFVGCAADGTKQASAYERTNHRTKAALLAVGDADSLAAAALLGNWPKADPAERLGLISKAVAAEPNRPDLIWLNIGVCIQAEPCDPAPLEARLRAVDPANGASWWVSEGQAAKANDAADAHKKLEAIAASTRFDTYRNATIVHATNAILKIRTMDPRMASTAIIGAEAALAIPPYQAIVNTCKAESAANPDVVATCRQVASVMRRGDTYLTEMVGIAIAKRAWPEGSAEYLDAINARRLAHYRIALDGKIAARHLWNSKYCLDRLRLMANSRTEQEVNFAEIEKAKLNPDPPSDWTDKWGGS